MPSPFSNSICVVLAFENNIVDIEFKVFLLEYPVYAINRTMFFTHECFGLRFWILMRKRGYSV